VPTPRDPLDLAVRELLEETATASVTPAGGAAAAVAVGLAAALAAMAARFSRKSWDGADAAVAQAETIRMRVAPLAAEDVAAYSDVFRLRREGADDEALGRALERAAEIPFRLAEAAADATELAVHVAGRCDPAVRVDAVAAAQLARAGAHIGSRIVAVNLATRPGDERAERARREAEAADRALSALA
jgi:glutamate formiminotransferase/formiminotetrahydrofolate cyclodeaminase